MIAIFFDLEKAFDTTWKYGILRDLHTAGLRGHLPIYIQNFLTDRYFRVRIGNLLSDQYPQELGVPQGSILSPTLFNIKINSITQCIIPNVHCTLYVDDFTIYTSSSDQKTAVTCLQSCLNNLTTWSNQNGFKFSQNKTVSMHFCRKCNITVAPNLKVSGFKIPTVTTVKFLGLTLDNRLSFLPHINNLKVTCNRSINLLKVVSSKTWGMNRNSLLTIYRSLIRSKLDYGCMIYNSACKTYLKQIDQIQNEALRVCLGAFRTSPIPSLQIEANEMPFYLRSTKLSLTYAIKTLTNPTNPNYYLIKTPKYSNLYTNSITPPFGIRIKPQLNKLNLNTYTLARSTGPKIAPWTLRPPSVFLGLSAYKKANHHPTHHLNNFKQIKRHFNNYCHIYTDGSKMDIKAAAAAVCPGVTLTSRLPDNASIFSAEAKAILLAMTYIETSNRVNHVIFSDSKSVLQAIFEQNWDNPLINQTLTKLNLLMHNKSIILCWIPSHVGILGNDKADTAAKHALKLNPTPLPIPYTDLKAKIHLDAIISWQTEWNLQINNKLHAINPTINQTTDLFLNRRDEIIITRLRLGHSYLTHSHLLNDANPPCCNLCHIPLTITHLLLDCPFFNNQRRKLSSTDNISNFFKRNSHTQIFDFLRTTDLYRKI